MKINKNGLPRAKRNSLINKRKEAGRLSSGDLAKLKKKTELKPVYIGDVVIKLQVRSLGEDKQIKELFKKMETGEAFTNLTLKEISNFFEVKVVPFYNIVAFGINRNPLTKIAKFTLELNNSKLIKNHPSFKDEEYE